VNHGSGTEYHPEPKVERITMPEDADRLSELCEKASTEKDKEKLTEVIGEISTILRERDKEDTEESPTTDEVPSA
jgi:hypothetical protein